MAVLPDVSVVVPTWNGAGWIGPLLDSLAEQGLAPDRFEVVVVDDGSTDGTADRIDRYAADHPRLQLCCVRMPHSGVNAARNAGIRASKGSIIVLLDDDESIEPDYLQRLLDLLEGDPLIPGIGGPARSTDDASFTTCDRCSIGDAVLPIEHHGPTPRLLGGNMAVRRSVFEEVGLFDPEISGRGDETEWFARADRQFLYDERLFVWHRRDHLNLRQLLMNGYRQGRSVPLLHAKLGDVEWRPSTRKVGRYLGHAVRARCVNGLLQAARELGALSSWWARRLAGRRSISSAADSAPAQRR